MLWSILTVRRQITQCLGSLVRATGEVETNIVSVERVLEFTGLPSEAPDVLESHRPPGSWPAQGAVKFVNYSTRYRPELDPVLRNINLDIRAKEKIGIVGRTGAGKSSLVLSLFRIIEPALGSIHIDDLNASSVGLLDLRRRVSIIPQDSALFEGTIRDNLDPDKAHDDTELWVALGTCETCYWVVWRPGLIYQIHRTCSTEGARCRHVWWPRRESIRRG